MYIELTKYNYILCTYSEKFINNDQLLQNWSTSKNINLKKNH